MRPPGVVAVVLVVVVVGAAGAGLLVARRGGESGPDEDLVILYGDSLSWEVAGVFTEAITANGGEALVRAVPGAAICDLVPLMRDDLEEHEPAVVVAEFVGNNSSNCVADLTGEALAARYADDAETVTELFSSAGIRLVWTGVPPAPGLPGGASELIDQGYRQLVDAWGRRSPGLVTYADAAEPVTGPGGEYVQSRPCWPDETEQQGCADGQIPVRSPDRIHFCPTFSIDDPCTGYSSGARRYGQTIASHVIEILESEALAR